ncbi:MAG: SoxR reducing system RseC family protein [Halanaerobiales bacterium]|nr:SoxR reducing system RseC family protein [Halanaerobiales bacterium]
MEETGQVIRIVDEKMAEIELCRHSACGKCGQCSHGENTRFEVHNPIQAQVGDVVVLKMETRHLLTAVMMVYMLPLVTLIVGYGLGSWFNSLLKIWQGEGFAIITGLIFMGLTFVGVKFYDRKLGLKSGFHPEIIKVITNN